MVKLLFWIEPVIEKERPLWKKGWADYFAYHLIRTLQPVEGGNGFDIRLAMGEAVAQALTMFPEIPRYVFSQPELLKPFGGDCLTATRDWFNGTYPPEAMRHLQEVVRGKLGDFTPDIIITFSPAPFLSALFPRALLLHHEYSLFSRKPYPETWYFDPVGMNGSAFLQRYHDALIPGPAIPTSELKALAEFKRTARELFEAKNPFKEILARERLKYRRLVLVPLMVSETYTFDAYVPYRNQLHYLTDVLERIPRTIGVLVTVHPDFNPLSEDVLAFLRARYPNMIYDPAFSDYYASSQFLIMGVDAVINVSSTVGIQTLMADTRLVALAPRYFGCLADATQLEDLEAVLDRPPRNKDPYLYWLLTRFAISKAYLHDSRWLSGFLNKQLLRFRSGKTGAEFFNEIAPPLELLTQYAAWLQPQIPERIVRYAAGNSAEAEARVVVAESELASELAKGKAQCVKLEAEVAECRRRALWMETLLQRRSYRAFAAFLRLFGR